MAERESELKLFIITLAGIFCWIFVIVACGLQRQFNLVALGFLGNENAIYSSFGHLVAVWGTSYPCKYCF